MQINHYPQTQFKSVGNDLMVGGRSVFSFWEEAGGAPLFLYDSDVIQQNVSELRRALPNRIQIRYAIKANPFPALVSAIEPWVDGVDVASERELRLALDAAFNGNAISIAGPGKSTEELVAAIEADVVINVESPTELARCAELSEKSGKRAQVCLRINPMLSVRASGVKMSGEGSPFGIDATQIKEVLSDFPSDCVDFLGFHVFACSQILSAEVLIEYNRDLFELIGSYKADLPAPLRYLTIGGGFGIPYFPGEEPLDVAAVGHELAQLLDQHRELIEGCQLSMEFGRYLVGNAGLYVSQVVDKKISGGQTFVIVNGGLHHHLANSGNFGQILRRNFPVAVANKMRHEKTQLVNISGPLCTPLDVVAHQMELPEIEIGDLIAVYNSGAYALSASPTNFLGRPEPVEILVR